MARLPYFGYSLLATVGGVIVMMLAGMIMQLGSVGTGIGMLLIIVAIGAMLWSGLALTMKRLHDLGLAGTHAIWVYMIHLSAGAVGGSSETLSILLGLVSLGVSLWLFFAPGNPNANQWGDVPV